MSLLGGIIGGAFSLLGGKSQEKASARAQAAQNEYNKPINIRKRAEEGGFNPLLWAGQGNIQAAPAQTGFMGSAIANAGLALQNGMNDAQMLKLEKTKLEQDRERLDALIEKQTIRPKQGGIYARVQQTPSIKKTGAPLLTGAGTATVFNPPSEYQAAPVGGPLVNTKVMRTDGMSSADPDTPPEFEADAFMWAREGTFFPNMNELARRNTPDWMHKPKDGGFWPKTQEWVKQKVEERTTQAEKDRKRRERIRKQNMRDEIAARRKLNGGAPLQIRP